MAKQKNNGKKGNQPIETGTGEKSFFAESLTIVRKYFVSRLLVSLIFAVVTWLIMGPLVLAVPGAIPVAIFVGLANLVPYIGPFVAMGVTALVVGLQTIPALGGIDPLSILWMMITLFGLQILDAVVLSPLMLGKSLGLHPLVVFAAITAGGGAFGIIGIIVAVPVAAIAALLVRRIRNNIRRRKAEKLAAQAGPYGGPAGDDGEQNE